MRRFDEGGTIRLYGDDTWGQNTATREKYPTVIFDKAGVGPMTERYYNPSVTYDIGTNDNSALAQYVAGQRALVFDPPDRIRYEDVVRPIGTNKPPAGLAAAYAHLLDSTHRSALAALGADPAKISVLPGETTGAAGQYYEMVDGKPVDVGWANTHKGDVTSLSHETIHRGIRQLVANGMLSKEDAAWLSDPKNNEAATRWYMRHTVGADDLTTIPSQYLDKQTLSNMSDGKPVGHAGLARVVSDLVNANRQARDNKDYLERLLRVERAAQDYYAQRKPSGPR